MPLFNISYFNTTNNFTLPINTPTYSKITLYGGGIFDDLWGEKYIRTQQEIDSLSLTVSPEWTPQTFILAKFDDNLQAGNIISLPSPIEKWLILRKAESESKFTKIAEVDDEVLEYVDRLARSKENYIYQLIPVAGDLLGEPLISDVTPTNFTMVTLLDPVENEGYSFCLDMQLSEIGTEEDLSVNDTKGKFQTMLKGNKKVRVGTIGVIATSTSDLEELEQDRLFIEQLENFILNGQEKIIKFPKGFSFRVYTSNWSMSKKEGTQNGNTIYRVAFEYREVGDL